MKVCDCLIFASQDDRLLIAVVELKSKTVHAHEILDKLKTCAEIAREILHRHQVEKVDVRFCPVLLAKRRSKSEFSKMTRTRIPFGGREREIIFKKYGSQGVPFSEIIA